MIYRITGQFRLLSHLVHSEGAVGTVAKFRTISVLQPNGEIVDVPAVSGNSIRGLLRRLSAAYLCEALELQPQSLSPRLYYALFAGGSLQKGVQQTGRDTQMFATLRATVPHLSLFGAAIAQEIMPGKLIVDWAYPICQETQAITGIESDIPAADLLEPIRYSRKDDLEDKPEELQSKDATKQQMLFEVEALIPGTVLAHACVLRGCTLLERGCFFAALSRLLENPYLGGQSGRGHGRFETTYEVDQEAKALYDRFLQEEGAKIREYLVGYLNGVA